MVVFDLDGTLLDSVPDLHRCLNDVLVAEGFGPVSLARVRSFVGDGARALVDRTVDAVGAPESAAADILERFLACYGDAPCLLSRPYAGAREALAHAKRMGPVSLCTNKPTAPTLQILNDLGWGEAFDRVVCGDTCTTRKPAPEMLEAAVAGLAHITDVIMVGDSQPDEEAARRAGCRFIWASYGYGKANDPLAADGVVAELAILPELLTVLA
ncbi:MAG: HAD-IA family hydrolase [Myxococcota bacterium]